MNTVTISVDEFYTNRAFYRHIPAPVFDALEAAFLAGKETAEVSQTDYTAMMAGINGETDR